MTDEPMDHEMNPMFDNKKPTSGGAEHELVERLNERVKDDPSAMLELSEIAYMRQIREQSVTEGE